jgi:hypothetical protein
VFYTCLKSDIHSAYQGQHPRRECTSIILCVRVLKAELFHRIHSDTWSELPAKSLLVCGSYTDTNI